MKNYPKWQRLGKQTLYKGRVNIVKYDAEFPDGGLTTYEVDETALGGVNILIKTKNNEIILAYQYRFPLDEWIYDLPGGIQDPDETPEIAAIREAQEEVGIVPSKLELLIKFYPNPGRASWPIRIFYCEDYSEADNNLDDPSEQVEPVHMPAKQLNKLIEQNKIIDPALLIAWHTAKQKGYL